MKKENEMKGNCKQKGRLLTEVEELRSRIAEFEKAETEGKRTEVVTARKSDGISETEIVTSYGRVCLTTFFGGI